MCLSHYKNIPTITVSSSSKLDLEKIGFKKIFIIPEVWGVIPLQDIPEKEPVPFNNGNLYHFELSEDRTELSLADGLDDKIADGKQEIKDTLAGTGFVGITDIEVGPDGLLYVVSLDRSGHDCDPKYPDCIRYDSPTLGTLFKVFPTN